jgi:hypothetical protein
MHLGKDWLIQRIPQTYPMKEDTYKRNNEMVEAEKERKKNQTLVK